MNVKNAVAGLIVAVLLGVTSAGAACDVSCAFAPASGNCHSGGAAAASAVSPAMDMPGMDMPDANGGQSQLPVSQASRVKRPHASADEMSLCERQFCGKDAFVFVRARRADAPKVASVLLSAPIRTAGASFRRFPCASGSFASRALLNTTPASLILRI